MSSQASDVAPAGEDGSPAPLFKTPGRNAAQAAAASGSELSGSTRRMRSGWIGGSAARRSGGRRGGSSGMQSRLNLPFKSPLRSSSPATTPISLPPTRTQTQTQTNVTAIAAAKNELAFSGLDTTNDDDGTAVGGEKLSNWCSVATSTTPTLTPRSLSSRSIVHCAHNTPTRRTRTQPGLHSQSPSRLSLHQPPQKKNYHASRSTTEARVSATATTTVELLSRQIKQLEEELAGVEGELGELLSGGHDYREEELQEHIARLHEYNEMKDIGQMLLGRLAELRTTTTSALYREFGLSLED